MPEAPDKTRTLKVIQLEYDYKKPTARLEGEFADARHVDKTVKVDAVVLTPSINVTALLLKDCVDSPLCKDALGVCAAISDSLDKRAAAVGSKSMPRITKSGRPGRFRVTPNSVMDILDRDDVRQGLFGAVAGTSTRPPRTSVLTKKRPELLERLRPLLERADQLHAQYFPDHYAFQLAKLKEAPKFRLWKTALSSVYIPKNLRSGYHRDRWNLRGTLSILLPLGEFTGGELVLPRWRIAIALVPGDLLIFNPQQLHGNLPIRGKRVSIVGYCARGLVGE